MSVCLSLTLSLCLSTYLSIYLFIYIHLLFLLISSSHQSPHFLQNRLIDISYNLGGSELNSSDDDDDEDEDADRLFHLRPVTSADFTQAIKKLKASVDDNGKELMKVTTEVFD